MHSVSISLTWEKGISGKRDTAKKSDTRNCQNTMKIIVNFQFLFSYKIVDIIKIKCTLNIINKNVFLNVMFKKKNVC